MKKQTKVLAAAAMLTLGASFSSMAALKNGTWVLNEEGWQYADKEGEYVEEEWCVSYGTEYWINEEGVLGASEWVSDSDGHTYYVQSDGSKTKSAWKYLYAEDEEDDSDAEEAWFYFDAKGRMVSSKSKYQIGDYYYYFDEDGKMLTGWVEKATQLELDNAAGVAAGDVAYCDPETGALVRNSWVNAFPWTEDSDEMYEGDDEEWYYTNGDGTPRSNTTRTIDGLKYVFGEDGIMLTEWVVKNNAGVYTESDVFDANTVTEVYYCDADYGYAKTNSWRELDNADDDTFWYYFDKTGKAFLATGSDAELTTGVRMVFTNGETGLVEEDSDTFVTESKKIDGVYYYFNDQGEMFDGLAKIGDKLMYLDGGARTTGKVTLTDDNENDYTFCFGDETDSAKGYEKYVAVTGNMDGYLYENGQLVMSDDSDVYLEKTVTNNGETATFVVDYRGKIMHKNDKDYEGAGTYTFDSDNEGWNEDCVATEK